MSSKKWPHQNKKSMTRASLTSYSEYIAKELKHASDYSEYISKINNNNNNNNKMTKQEVINTLVDAITASDKKFSEIKKDSIFAFMKQEGVPNSQCENIYSDLSKIYRDTKVSNNSNNSKIEQTKEVVDYLNTTHNDVKQRTPRKSIFSEISKIAG